MIVPPIEERFKYLTDNVRKQVEEHKDSMILAWVTDYNRETRTVGLYVRSEGSLTMALGLILPELVLSTQAFEVALRLPLQTETPEGKQESIGAVILCANETILGRARVLRTQDMPPIVGTFEDIERNTIPPMFATLQLALELVAQKRDDEE